MAPCTDGERPTEPFLEGETARSTPLPAVTASTVAANVRPGDCARETGERARTTDLGLLGGVGFVVRAGFGYPTVLTHTGTWHGAAGKSRTTGGDAMIGTGTSMEVVGREVSAHPTRGCLSGTEGAMPIKIFSKRSRASCR